MINNYDIQENSLRRLITNQIQKDNFKIVVQVVAKAIPISNTCSLYQLLIFLNYIPIYYRLTVCDLTNQFECFIIEHAYEKNKFCIKQYNYKQFIKILEQLIPTDVINITDLIKVNIAKLIICDYIVLASNIKCFIGNPNKISLEQELMMNFNQNENQIQQIDQKYSEILRKMENLNNKFENVIVYLGRIENNISQIQQSNEQNEKSIMNSCKQQQQSLQEFLKQNQDQILNYSKQSNENFAILHQTISDMVNKKSNERSQRQNELKSKWSQLEKKFNCNQEFNEKIQSQLTNLMIQVKSIVKNSNVNNSFQFSNELLNLKNNQEKQLKILKKKISKKINLYNNKLKSKFKFQMIQQQSELKNQIQPQLDQNNSEELVKENNKQIQKNECIQTQNIIEDNQLNSNNELQNNTHNILTYIELENKNENYVNNNKQIIENDKLAKNNKKSNYEHFIKIDSLQQQKSKLKHSIQKEIQSREEILKEFFRKYQSYEEQKQCIIKKLYKYLQIINSNVSINALIQCQLLTKLKIFYSKANFQIYQIRILFCCNKITKSILEEYKINFLIQTRRSKEKQINSYYFKDILTSKIIQSLKDKYDKFTK